MDIEKLVKSELHKIHRTRNRVGYLPNIVSLFLSLYFQRAGLLFDTRWWLVIVLMVVGTSFRIIVNEVLFKGWHKEVKWIRILNWFAYAITGLSWGLHFSDIFFHYGGESTHTMYTFLVIVAFMTGASTFNMGDKIAYYLYVLCISGTIAFTYLTDAGNEQTYVVFNILIFLGFSFTNYRINRKQLLDLLEAKISSQLEKDNLNRIINTVPGFVGLIDKNLVCYMANQSTLSLFPNIIGSKIGELDPRSTWEAFIIDFMKSSRLTDVAEHHTLNKGEEISVLINIQRMEDGGAIIVSIITTEIVKAEKMLREQEAKAYYTSKLASLGEMAAGIAHEVNNPLTIIQGSANVLNKIVNTQPLDVLMVQDLTKKMIETCERISKTIKSLKALSRNGENDPMTSVSINKVIEHCLDISQQKCRNSEINLVFSGKEFDAFVLGREVELSQVLLNLLLNAIDAVKNLPEKWIKLEVMVKNGFVEIYVKDSGHGIPEEIRDKIMNPFFSTKDVNQGTGLGLSISKNIITAHKGELTLIDSEPNTTFRIKLPLEKTGF